jgi:hypothetical protein
MRKNEVQEKTRHTNQQEKAINQILEVTHLNLVLDLIQAVLPAQEVLRQDQAVLDLVVLVPEAVPQKEVVVANLTD